MKNKPSLSRSLITALAVVVVFLAFAYGVQVTDVNFETTRSVDRLTSLKRVIRALVKPDLIEYDLTETFIEIPFYLPCPEDQEIEVPEPDTSGPYLTASEYCASPDETVIIEGHNLIPRTSGPLDFITASGVKKTLGDFRVDDTGSFEVEVTMPIRQPVAEAQHIRATARVRVGAPKLTETAIVTWDKIVETVFMALLATAIGTVLAIPVSFLAARNLMAENKSPLSSVALAIIGWPVGIYLGFKGYSLARSLLTPMMADITNNLIGIAVGLLVVFVILRWAFSSTKRTGLARVGRIVALVLAGLAAVGVMLFLEELARNVGRSLIEPLGGFGFIGNFLFQLGEAATLIIPAFTALGAGAVLGSTLGGIGQTISDKSPAPLVKVVESILPGPLEAVQATGANRLQTIIYAVVPQIVSPYISFTLYRWDINVRMSTIIGFVGGGGIGFLLQQNINLLDYRAASAQMLAIAVVVAIMDYVSSAIRERIV
ncbi:MAG: ABC transporter permease subunit [Anaerolineales bacterium]